MKHTPLHEEHLRLSAKMVDYAGYDMPVQYPNGTIKEHLAVRQQVGIFDCSHMGEIRFTGPGAAAFLDYILTNVMSTLAVGRIRYGVMCQEDGGAIDDLIVYRLAQEDYLVVVNASNREKDLAWMEKQVDEWNGPAVQVQDRSDDYALIAIQGPKTKEVMAKVGNPESYPKKYYSFTEDVLVADRPVLLSRTGYTGEFGYEIYCKPEDASHIWQTLLEQGKEEGIEACGLGARDTLRLEAGMPLYGHELSEEILPSEIGLDFAIKLDREAFIGQDALRQKPRRKRIGLKVDGRGIMREGHEVKEDGKVIGQTTSGTMSPLTKDAIAMALVAVDAPLTGTLTVDVRGRELKVNEVELPFYKK